jgi:hypothetical protein
MGRQKQRGPSGQSNAKLDHPFGISEHLRLPTKLSLEFITSSLHVIDRNMPRKRRTKWTIKKRRRQTLRHATEPTKCYLLSMPVEIRMMIYDWALWEPEGIVLVPFQA